MNVSVGNGSLELHFGKGLVLSSLEAEPVRFAQDFPGTALWDRTPLDRWVMLEGYIMPTSANTEDMIEESAQRRRLISTITAPGGEFYLRVDGRTAYLTEGQLVFKRHAPFSGDTSEHFTLRGKIRGGYFLGETVTVLPKEKHSGFSFPLADGGGFTVGEYSGSSYIEVHNGGDVPTGFTAELIPAKGIPSFSLADLSSGCEIVLSRSFIAGDVIKISTHRDDLYVRVTREGRDYDLTGYATDSTELFALPVGRTVLSLGGGAVYSGKLTFTERYGSF